MIVDTKSVYGALVATAGSVLTPRGRVSLLVIAGVGLLPMLVENERVLAELPLGVAIAALGAAGAIALIRRPHTVRDLVDRFLTAV